MSGLYRIDCGFPAVLEFRGPDAVRFLNGQLTQDVRLVADGKTALPSCVTDAKGRFQFRVWLSAADDGALRVDAPPACVEALEARLTRYLIADDVEVLDLTGKWSLVHFTGVPAPAPEGVMARAAARCGVPGTDWWIPEGLAVAFPAEMPVLEGDALEAFRIANGVPLPGRELTEGLLPPEAGLDATDISYRKGCYIGQEVISRIKSAGKVNQCLVRFTWDGSLPPDEVIPVDAAGNPAGRLTSVSPVVEGGLRHALGFVKRGVAEVFVRTADGVAHPATWEGTPLR